MPSFPKLAVGYAAAAVVLLAVLALLAPRHSPAPQTSAFRVQVR